MAGFVACGAYIPKYRLSRDLIARAWGVGSMGGEKAVANYDEDTVTMAVEAAADCLGSIDTKKVDGLYFASTSPPYKEKQSASLIATVLDFRRDILTADFSNSLRAGTNALKAGLDAVDSKSAKLVLAAAADCRLGAAESSFEQILGDGAAAFLLGNSDVIADVTGSYSVSDECTDNWRMEEDKFVNSWEDRFSNIHGYMNSVQGAVTGVLNKYKFTPGEFSKLVLYAPGPRQHADIARRLGFDIKTQLSDLLFTTVGNSGTALAQMMLVAALQQAQPGDKLLFVSYGEGAQAFILEVTPNIEKIKDRRGIDVHLASKTMLPSYEKYIQFRNLMPTEATRVFQSPSSIPLFWREKKSFFSFYGSKCKRCSLIQHPIQRICYGCQSKDEYDEVKLSRTGKIFTYSEDYLADVPVLPQISATVDLDDGARVFLRLTEIEAQNPKDPPQKIGMPVETTFRKMHDNSGFRNYYWRARPVRRES